MDETTTDATMDILKAVEGGGLSPELAATLLDRASAPQAAQEPEPAAQAASPRIDGGAEARMVSEALGRFLKGRESR